MQTLNNQTDTGSQHQFRGDIEGLRAISIVAVVGYHAQIQPFSGGYVGVDIFFVISGFLICGMLLREISATGRINVRQFWLKRARRLMPNACLTLLAILVSGYILVPPHAREQLTQEVVSALFYFANYQFASKAVDYFHFDDPHSPVMHYWSLSVEEQFYIVCPLLFLIVARVFPRWRINSLGALLLIVWGLSFVASVVFLKENQPKAFFHTEARAWQLSTGGLVAFIVMKGITASPLNMKLIGAGGLLTILCCIVFLHDRLTYPGALALLPTLAAAAVIFASHHKQVSRSAAGLLDQAPLRWLGARSYSWYLWHWPVILFLPTCFVGLPHAELWSVGVSMLIASVVYSFIENPVRRNERWLNPQPWAFAKVASLAATVLFGAFVFAKVPAASNLVGGELTEKLKFAATDYGQNYADKCHLAYDETEQPKCIYGEVNSSRRVVLFGDSHAAQWFAPLNAAARDAKMAMQSWTKSSCPSVDVFVWFAPRKAAFQQCTIWRSGVLDRLTGAEKPEIVILSNLVDYSGWLQNGENGAVLEKEAADKAWREGLRTTINRLVKAGIYVVVLRDTPQAYKSFAKCLQEGGAATCDRPRSQAVFRTQPDVAVAQGFSSGVSVLDLTDRICNEYSCPVLKDGQIVYLDRHHINASFALTLRNAFDAILVNRK